MKRNFLKSLLGILAFLTFAGLGFAQKPSVTFNPPSGTSVAPGTVVNFTINNPSDLWDGSYYWLRQGESLDEIENPNVDLTAGNTTTGSFTITETTKAVKIAIVVGEGSPSGNDEYADNADNGFVLKCFSASYNVETASANEITFNPPSGSTVKPGTTVSFTINNPSDLWEGSYYWLRQGESLDEIENPNVDLTAGDSPNGTFTVTESTKAVKIAIIVGMGSPNEDDEYADNADNGFVLKCISATYTIDENAGDIGLPKAEAPTFSTPAGEVDAGTKIIVRPINETYIAVGETKPESGYILNNNVGDDVVPILTINEAKTIWAFTKKDGFSNSDTISATYTVKAPAPQPTVTFNPPSGTEVEEETKIELTSNNPDLGSEYWRKLIKYEIGETLETTKDVDINSKAFSSTNQSGWPTITPGKTAIKAGIVIGLDEESIQIYKQFEATYTIKQSVPEPIVVFSPESGSTVEEETQITLTGQNLVEGRETIYYMTGTSAESIPNFTYNNAKTYTQPISITAEEPVIKAMLIVGEESGDFIYSYFTASYIVTAPAPAKPEAPVITPKGGTVLVNTPVTIAKGTADSIFYTTGTGATATFTKSLEDVKITITANTVLRAFAMKEGVRSDTATESYKVPAGPTDPTKATVRLVVDGKNCPHKDRNQYQVLLDSSHTITNDFKADLETASPMQGISTSLLPYLYGEKTSTVPTGITATNATTSGVYPDDEAAVLVDPGTYDIFLLQSYYANWSEKDIIRGVEKVSDRIEGDRYFTLDDMTLEAGKSYVFNVTFDQGGAHGELLVSVDLQLSHILGENKPSCELDSIRLSLAIKNVGLTTIDQYIAYCTNGKDTVKETVTNAIDAGESILYTFTKKLELKGGQNTVLKAGIIVENETNTTDNTAEYTVFKSEVGTLPLDIEPSKMLSANAGNWSIDEKNKALVASRHASTPIFSSCFHAEEAGKYRLSYGYICGRYVELPDGTIFVNNVDVYEIRVGKTSENYTEWQSVLVDSSRVGSSNYSEFEPKDIVFDLEEAGDYAFCIIPKRVNDNNNLKFRNLSVEQMSSQSARFNAFNILSPRIVPQDWGTATYKAEVAVENRGLENLENATLAISVNGKVVKNETFSLTTAEKVKTLSVEVPVEGFKKGDKMKFSGELLAGTLSMRKANAVPAEITVSENTAAFDYITDFIAVSGMQSYTGALVGLIFPVVEKDTLTAISCGWATELGEDMLIGLSIHKVSFEGEQVVMGETFYNGQVRRGTDNGLNTYNLPALLLEPGHYFIAVEQLGLVNFGLAMDESPEGGIHVYDKTEKEWKYITTGGYPVVRAVFGSEGILLNKDAAITAISKPIAGGIFAENEPIVVSVCNNGYETVEIPVYVRVDNTVLEPKTVSVEPYHTEEVSFTANLAATGQNRNITLTAFTALSGDEDHSNDTLRKNVLSMVPADPYRMDFESCLDFATEGLNPAWTSVSLDKSPVMPLRHVLEDHTFQYIEFPGSETDLGFIAFNPLETEPSMVLFDFYNECRSHSGQRFGVSLGITNENAAKNDWLISPKLKMPSNNTQLSMWVKSFDRVYKESYEIWISEGSGDPTSEDFIRLYPGEDEEALLAPTEWTQAVFNLSRYNGREIHVAIRCNSDDAPMFMIDDIVIGENVSNEEEPQADFRLSVYPNPAKEMVSLLSPDAAIKNVSIFNLSGNLVHRSANNLNTDNYRYNASALTAGMYFVRVETEKGTAIRKFVIQ